MTDNFNTRPIARINSERIELSVEQIQSVYAKVNAHNKVLIGDAKIFSKPHYVIQLTGDKQVYFTLYKFTPPIEGRPTSVYVPYVPYRYLKNVSIDILKAVDLYTTGKGLPIQVWADDNFKPIQAFSDEMPIFTFGKYRGCTMEDVFERDAQYIIWYSKQEVYVNRYGNSSKKDITMKRLAKEYADLYFQTLAEKNRTECTSEHIGVLKVRQEITITVNYIKSTTCEYGEETVKASATDEEGNFIMFYVNRNLAVEKGLTYRVKATPVAHYESLGRKTTRINRIAIQ